MLAAVEFPRDDHAEMLVVDQIGKRGGLEQTPVRRVDRDGGFAE
jgi:hypothetical protein